MKNAKYLLVPVVVTLMVLVVSLYPPANITRKASAAPRSAVVAKYLMMPAAAFQVTEAGKDYYNYGYFLGFSSGIGSFVAPVYLPAGARIRSIKETLPLREVVLWVLHHVGISGKHRFNELRCDDQIHGQPVKGLEAATIVSSMRIIYRDFLQ
jgi:hypothetical protein